MRLIFANIFMLVFVLFGYAQEEEKMSASVMFDLSYEFKDGVYLNFAQFRNNKPMSYSSTSLPDPAQMNPELAMQESGGLEYFDDYGNRQFLQVDQVWGYAYRDKVYVGWRGEFHLLSYIGSISHFVAQVTVYHDRMNDPFYDPYYMYSGPSSYASKEMVQLLIDMSTGNIMQFSPENVSVLLKNEPELQEEYLGLRKRKRQKLMFYYIRQYNEKTPLYFPVD